MGFDAAVAALEKCCSTSPIQSGGARRKGAIAALGPIGKTSVWGGSGLKLSAKRGIAEASTPFTPPARQRGRRRGGN